MLLQFIQTARSVTNELELSLVFVANQHPIYLLVYAPISTPLVHVPVVGSLIVSDYFLNVFQAVVIEEFNCLILSWNL